MNPIIIDKIYRKTYKMYAMKIKIKRVIMI